MIAMRDKIYLQFGYGDIGITCGSCVDEDGVKCGVIGFNNIEPREIGVNSGVKTSKIEEIPILCTFSDTRSIDVLIKALKEAKKSMTKEVE